VVIQELKPSKRIKGRWLAVLEDGSILRVGENEVLNFGLYEGRELEEDEALRLQQSVRSSGLKEKTIELLSRKPMSRREAERKLEQWEASPEETAAICDRMEELGFLNDAEYAARLVRHYSAKGYGARKLRDELYHRGVPREFWEDALEQAQTSAQAIDEFLARKLGGKSVDRKELKKISDALARRGFSWSEIDEGIRRCGVQLEDLD
jgi:regulatory protein